ncbi:PREDICTED: SUN domain-containing protein 1 [Hipposideros armiger]|uniref:SUN domain-containing protein 1 n=1 Tax=Hipposideros armiger TaxID=186990 RepID=A0A8B7QWA0_HIPAR|nr:PREDICTED: SUN domain-containing protein 1 [Hipposideros armiger]
MDFSRLHMYTPPQCVPENTGYTYALSSSYSSDALDFETEHKLDPVFDSPRMSRRGLHPVSTASATAGGQAGAAKSCTSSTVTLRERVTRTARQRGSAGRPALRAPQASRRVATALRPPVLDESLIREQTRVDHFWGLDDDGDLKGGSKAVIQGNGDVAAEAAKSNGYTCSRCSLLSERKDALTAVPAACGAVSRVYSRDRNQKRGASFYLDRILWLVTCTSSSFSSFLVQLFRVVLMKRNYESENYKLKSYESKDHESESYKSKSHESKAHFDPCGRRNVRAFLREDGHLSVNGEALCDDCQGKEHLETPTAVHPLSSRLQRAAGSTGSAGSHAGHFLMQTLRRIGAVGWCVSEKLLSALCLAMVAPGKAASATFWLLGSGWYQFVTWISWLNVFLLTRCLRNICKFLILLILLLLLLGAGLSLWGQADLLSFLPVVNWTRVDIAQRVDDRMDTLTPGPLSPPLQSGDEAIRWREMSEVQRQVASLSGQCWSHDEKLRELAASLQKLQAQVDQMDGDRGGMSPLATDVGGPHLKDVNADGPVGSQRELRISNLEDALGKLMEKYEAVQRELEQTTLRTASGAEDGQRLLSAVKVLELELGHLRSELSQHLEGGCDKVDAAVRDRVDAQVRETVQLLLSDDPQAVSLEWLFDKLSSRFVSKDNLQVLLRDLELQILKNISHHVSVTKQLSAREAVVSAVNEAGVSGITEAQAHVIINNALKLYSQDKTGMVDFALESGGGSILSTRCSETYETKTALISLFGIPLWYFSQSPRVVIQVSGRVGAHGAWCTGAAPAALRAGAACSRGAASLSGPREAVLVRSVTMWFCFQGLESEYEEEGQLLGQFTYDQEGESLQMFHVPKRPERAFQIVELRIFSNWGHPEYTCLYRFRVHGEPIK